MVKKSISLMSFFAFGLILESGAEAAKNRLMVEEGQRRLYECNGIPLKVKTQLRNVALRKMNQQQQEAALRKIQKENIEKNAQRYRDYFIKVDTKK